MGHCGSTTLPSLSSGSSASGLANSNAGLSNSDAVMAAAIIASMALVGVGAVIYRSYGGRKHRHIRIPDDAKDSRPAQDATTAADDECEHTRSVLTAAV